MPAVTYEITTYRYEFRRSPTGSMAVIWLSSGDRVVCVALFVEDVYILPPPREGANGVISITMRSSALLGIIDMLRNEKPVYFLWSPETQVASITTSAEPVGEGELDIPPLPPQKQAKKRVASARGRRRA